MSAWQSGTKRLVDAEQQQTVANASLLPSWGCTLEDLRAHQRSWILHGMCRCSHVHVADDSLDGSIIDWAVEGSYFSCDRFGSRVHRLWTVNYSSGTQVPPLQSSSVRLRRLKPMPLASRARADSSLLDSLVEALRRPPSMPPSFPLRCQGRGADCGAATMQDEQPAPQAAMSSHKLP